MLKSSAPLGPKWSALIALLLGVCGAFALLLTLEYCSSLYLRAHGAPAFSLLYHAPPQLTPRQGERGPFVFSYLDPQLGYAASPLRNRLIEEIPGFVRYGSPEAPLRIVALGGSTTDAVSAVLLGDTNAQSEDPYNWPRDLQRLLAFDGIEAVVFNGGTVGYTSSQDLFKLIRDAIALRPDIVIALEGINDFALLLSVPGHAHITKYQARSLDAVVNQTRVPILMPNVLTLLLRGSTGNGRAVDGYTLGVPEDRSRVHHWHRNMLLAESACRATGIQYLNLLQPVMGVGTYLLSEEERCMLEAWPATNRESLGAYFSRINLDYQAARALCALFPECADMTEIFAGEAHVYFDPLHPNERGVDLLAREIYQELVRRGMLPFAPAGA